MRRVKGASASASEAEVGGIFAVTDGERRAAPGADQQSRVAGEHDRERERAFELRQGRGRGGLRVEAALHVGIDQVGDDLGIGVGGEFTPLRLQLCP